MSEPTIEITNSGVRIMRGDGATLFYAPCSEHFDVDTGCVWTLSPDYRTGNWIAKHGQDTEAVLPFDRSEPFDAETMICAISDWVERVHAYEAPA